MDRTVKGLYYPPELEEKKIKTSFETHTDSRAETTIDGYHWTHHASESKVEHYR